MSTPVETSVVPPEVIDADDGEDLRRARIGCHLIGSDDVSYDANTQLFGAKAADPAAFADGLLRAVLALAALRGPDYSWAVMQRFAAYDGMPG